MPSYNLLTEPWIPVLWEDGKSDQAGLESVFRDSAKIVKIMGSPVEAVSILRLLLAIVHQVETPNSLNEWGQCWNNRDSIMHGCVSYLHQHSRAWDLLHEERPFGQVAGQQGTVNPAHLLVYEAARKNNPVHADHSQAENPPLVRSDSLARGILATNAFAGSSGGGYRSGPLCVRSVATIEGKNLAETLVLNLLTQKEPPAAIDWKSYGQIRSTRSRIDICQRYLWTSRSILLTHEEGSVRTMMLAPGNEMPEEERKEDPMIPYRPDSTGKSWVPLRLEPGRALWRSAHVLLNWGSETKQIAALDQIRRVGTREILPQSTELSLRVCAVSGDAQGPSTDLWRDESITFSLQVLESERRFTDMKQAIAHADETATTLRKRVFGFAHRYLQGSAESKPDPNDVGSLADELSPDLAPYWAELAPMGERIACDDFDEDKWNAKVREAAEKAFRDAVDRLPPDARRFRAEYAVSSGDEKKKKVKSK